ncbi:MAG TPA: hypothetical protein VIK95_11340 [Egibacteraceae bacterium]
MRRHVYYYTMLEVPYEQAAAVLRESPQRWLPDPARHQGGEWHVALHADGALPPAIARRDALVTVGEPAQNDNLMLALEWRSATADRLFPVLTADLELVRLESGCQLSLMGTYRPPLAVVGEATDRLLGHRVAEATVRRFVLDVAARVERLVSLPA